MNSFPRLKRLPPYALSVLDALKAEKTQRGEPIFDFGLGNPDYPTPPHIVEALRQASLNPKTHRYTETRGIPELLQAICNRYQKQFQVELNPREEAIVTIGSKEGLAHLALATLSSEDSVIVPNPCYPVHHFGQVIADAEVRFVSLFPFETFCERLEKVIRESYPTPKMLVLNFPANPSTHCVDLHFFEKIIALAKEYKIWVVHDLAYADLVFDDYKAPSILQVKDAKDISVESYTLSKSFNMAGWRVGFMCGNKILIDALAKIKSYLDYGSFAAVQYAAVAALEGPQDCVEEIRLRYQQRRNVLCDGLNAIGWEVSLPKATMFVWAKIPEAFHHLGSLEFSKLLLREANVVVSPGVAFGECGNQYVRFGLIENEIRMQEAIERMKQVMQKHSQHKEELA